MADDEEEAETRGTQSLDVDVNAMSLEDALTVLDAFGYSATQSGKTYRLVKK